MADFPSVDPLKVTDKICQLEIAGKPITPKKAYSCALCRRSVLPMGRMIRTGFLTCSHDDCELTPLSKLSKLFPTPYGCAVHMDILSVFGGIVDVHGRLYIRRRKIVQRASILATAYNELIEWQKAFDLYERLTAPRGYEEGRVQLVPPRRIDEVLALRAVEDCELIAPTRRYPAELGRTLRRIRRKGVEGFEVPF